MEERRVKYPLGSLSQIEAKTFGEPGHRTFSLNLLAGTAQCSVWLEKEQLFQLGIYLQDAIRSQSAEERQRPSEPKEAEWSDDGTKIEFRAGQVMLSHDAASNSFYLLVYEREEEESSEEMASVSFWITTDQADVLAQEALKICSAGRPLCVLCGLPIDPEGHVCPRSNGHTVLEVG